MGKNRFLSLVLCMSLVLTLVSCASQKENESNETKNMTNVSWYINYSWFTACWGDNVVSKDITKKTDTSVSFITPTGRETEKLNALLASDSLPDLITLGWWEPQVNEMIEKGMVYALNELADKYDSSFWKVSSEKVVDWYTRKDGNIYCYPNSFYEPQDIEKHDNIASNETFLVRKDIYEAIGSPDMTTTEGFEAAVKKAKKMFPTVGGKSLIPIGSHVFDQEGCVSFDKYLQNFLAVPFEKNEEIYDRTTDKEYLRWLKMFRKLGQEGYLSPDIFVDTRTQMEEKLEQGRYFCMLYQYTDMLAQQKALYEKSPNQIYMAVDGPKNAKGEPHRLPTTGINGWTVTFISKKCKAPEKAMKFLDYLMSEDGQKVTYLGVEGVTYNDENGKFVLKDDVKKLLNSNRAEYDRKYAADDTYWMLQNNATQLKWKQDSPAYVKQLEEWTYPYVIYNGQYDILLDTESDENKMEDRITKLWSVTLPKLLLASSDEEFETLLRQFKGKRRKMGFEKIQQTSSQKIKEAKKKLGIK